MHLIAGSVAGEARHAALMDWQASTHPCSRSAANQRENSTPFTQPAGLMGRSGLFMSESLTQSGASCSANSSIPIGNPNEVDLVTL